MNDYRDENGNLVAKLSEKTVNFIMDNIDGAGEITTKKFKVRDNIKVLLFKGDTSMQINREGEKLYFWKGSYIEL